MLAKKSRLLTHDKLSVEPNKAGFPRRGKFSPAMRGYGHHGHQTESSLRAARAASQYLHETSDRSNILLFFIALIVKFD